MPKKSRTTPFFSPKKFILLPLVLLVAVYFFLLIFRQQFQTYLSQNAIDPFYQPPPLTDNLLPGQIIRSQPLAVNISHGKAYRILYVSQLSAAGKTFSSGIIFIPNADPPPSGRKIIAWAHGTIGMGDICAPSRNPNFLTNLPWVDQMLEQNFVVTATDYSGLGTPGVERYLLGNDQAMDILNSIKAVSQFPGANTSRQFGLWGHSQGGQAALFAAHLSPKLLPQFKLVGVAVAAPATELISLVRQQQSGPIPWVIASEISRAWPLQYANLDISHTLTPIANDSYQQIADECITLNTLQSTIRADLEQNFFQVDPTTIPSWKQAFIDQTPTPLPPTIPLLVIQSLSDQVVLPNTTAQFIDKSCRNSSNLQTLWLNDVDHQNTAIVSSPSVIDWLNKRFAKIPIQNSCAQNLPVAPF